MPTSLSRFKRPLTLWLWRTFDEIILFVGIASALVTAVYLVDVFFPAWRWYGDGHNGYNIVAIIDTIGAPSSAVMIGCIVIVFLRWKYPGNK